MSKRCSSVYFREGLYAVKDAMGSICLFVTLNKKSYVGPINTFSCLWLSIECAKGLVSFYRQLGFEQVISYF